MYKIIADSAGDLLTGDYENFTSIPMHISTNEKSFTDDKHLVVSSMLEYLESYNGRSYTACPGTYSWIDAFEGCDEVYIVTITSGLSGSYNSAMVARETYLEDHPDAKIAVFDSLSTGPEMKMAVEKIIELKKSGMSFEEIQKAVNSYIKNVRLFFVLGSLHNLSQNGRVHKTIAAAAGLIGIQLIGYATDEGKIDKLGFARGERKIINKVISELSAYKCSGSKIEISHVENPAFAQKAADAIKAAYPDADIIIYPARGLCSFYGERGGLLIGFETK